MSQTFEQTVRLKFTSGNSVAGDRISLRNKEILSSPEFNQIQEPLQTVLRVILERDDNHIIREHEIQDWLKANDGPWRKEDAV